MTTATVADTGDIRVEELADHPPGYRVWVGTEYVTCGTGDNQPYEALAYWCNAVWRGIVRARKGEWVDQRTKRTKPAHTAKKAKV